MPPNSTKTDSNTPLIEDGATGALSEEHKISTFHAMSYHKAGKREYKIIWRNVVIVIIVHLSAIYGLYLMITSAQWKSFAFAFFLYIISGFGITTSAHRLWAHKAYKAKYPLKLILVCLNTIAFQGPIINWARDHRMHHKYTETDADPHNSTRGFFFCHIGWLLVRKHPAVKAKAHTIDLSDLYAEPLLRFQKKYYYLLMPLANMLLPTLIPAYFWGESYSNAFHVCSSLRYIYTLHMTWALNSIAHMFGTKPYDRFIKPVENRPLAMITLGEGFHNYHHTFPWDYKTGEFGSYAFNLTKGFLDLMAWIGWAYDLKSVSDELIEHRSKRTGDGSHHIWGWGDKDQTKEERDMAEITYKKR